MARRLAHGGRWRDHGDMMTGARALAGLMLAGCTGADARLPDEGPPPQLSGPLLSFDSTGAAAADSDALPGGFTVPQPTVCSPDPTRGFLTELIDHGVTDPSVPYEWAPVVAGPTATHPTLDQPEFFISGTVTRLERSGLDFRPAHPFGFDTTWDIVVDDPFVDMVVNRAGDPNDGDATHCEIERGLYPDAAFGFAPTPGDRALMKGAWIFDCGHPAYETELHPATFLAFARADGQSTTALAFANPYRVAQLYGPVALVDRFDDATRYDQPGVSAFTTQLTTQIIRAAVNQIEQFELHPLLEPTRFEPVTWFVCAPAPRPAGAELDFSYRFVARTGVTITVATRGDSGCLRFHAELGASYVPAVPARTDYLWTWAQISAEASSQYGQTIDVRMAALEALAQQGFTGDIPALHEDVPLIIDQYAPLAPRASASADAPTEIATGADDQPFPFYGRVRVSWR
jgi:hypothetical protein